MLKPSPISGTETAQQSPFRSQLCMVRRQPCSTGGQEVYSSREGALHTRSMQVALAAPITITSGVLIFTSTPRPRTCGKEHEHAQAKCLTTHHTSGGFLTHLSLVLQCLRLCCELLQKLLGLGSSCKASPGRRYSHPVLQLNLGHVLQHTLQSATAAVKSDHLPPISTSHESTCATIAAWL